LSSTNVNIEEFILGQSNQNTLSKTLYDIKILKEFLQQPEINESREIQNIPPAELSTILSRFFITVRKSNGSEYEPTSLRGMMSSFDRQLRRFNYGEYIATSPKFSQVREVLKSKQKLLKREGKGNFPNKADPINDQEIEILWQKKQLGSETPDSILQTLWFYNTVHFGLRGRSEHRDMCWGDVTLKSNTNGHEYLEFCERQTKTRTGNDPRNIREVTPKLWANVSNPDRCPIKIYKIYANKRPAGYSLPHNPFYIATTTKPLPSEEETWFKKNAVGINKLGNMMSTMVKNANIPTSKKLSNHSARKYLIQKLSDSNVPPTHIAQISGHRNVSSINKYSHINNDQHRNISQILHQNTCENSNTQNSENPARSCQPHQSFNSANSFRRESTQTINVSGGIHSVLSAPVYGGTFNINVYPNQSSRSPDQPKRKRLRILDSDSETE
jgi:integrase